MSSGTSERPLGLSLLIWLFWFWAGAIVLVLLGFAIGEGPIMMNGGAVSRSEALGTVAPLFVPMGAAVIGAALGLGLGRRWARPAALLPFLLLGIAPSLTGGANRSPWDLVLAAVVMLPVIAALFWYLFRSPSVVAYFEAQRSRRVADAAGLETGDNGGSEPPPADTARGADRERGS